MIDPDALILPAGAAIDEEWIERLVAVLRSLRVEGADGGGVEVVPGIGGTSVRALAGITKILVRTPSGGIPARSGGNWGSATCELYSRSGTTSTLSGISETVWNEGDKAVPGSKDAYCFRDRSGRLFFDGAFC